MDELQVVNPNIILMVNAIIAAISLGIVYAFDWPVEVIGVAGLAWVIIFSLSTLLNILRANRRRSKHPKPILLNQDGYD